MRSINKYLVVLAAFSLLLLGSGFPENLWIAIAMGKTSVVREIIEAHPEYVNVRDDRTYNITQSIIATGFTPLHLCAYSDSCNTEILEILIDSGADIEAKDEYGRTPLYIALECENPDIAEMLILKNADVNVIDKSKSDSALSLAVKNMNPEIVKMLLERGAEPDFQNLYGLPTLRAAMKDPELVKLLLAHGADVNAKDRDGKTPIYVLGCFPESVELIIKNGAEVSTKAWGTDMTAPEPFGSWIPDVTPLHYSAGNCIEVVRILIKNGADVNAQDGAGNTPLHLAADCGKVEIIKALIAAGADISIKNVRGQLPLHCACNSFYPAGSMIELLIASPDDLLEKDEEGNTPLHYAARGCNDGAVEKILKLNPEAINARNNDGDTALKMYKHRNNPYALRSPDNSCKKTRQILKSYKGR